MTMTTKLDVLQTPTAAPSLGLCPGRDCPRCPRLVAFRRQNRFTHPDWHNAPVDSFGPLEARLLVVGLAPGLKGANATGRPFTGDWAGQLLYGTLLAKGLARGSYGERRDDGLELIDCRITNAVRCVPPANRPLPAEAAQCRPYLANEMAAMPRLQAILAIGGLAHEAVLAARGVRKAAFPFAHGAQYRLPDGMWLFDSYHCSRLNTNTGRLTAQMFHQVMDAILAVLPTAQPVPQMKK
jgi:uracil-DNA glycosylase family 4